MERSDSEETSYSTGWFSPQGSYRLFQNEEKKRLHFQIPLLQSYNVRLLCGNFSLHPHPMTAESSLHLCRDISGLDIIPN